MILLPTFPLHPGSHLVAFLQLSLSSSSSSLSSSLLFASHCTQNSRDCPNEHLLSEKSMFFFPIRPLLEETYSVSHVAYMGL